MWLAARRAGGERELLDRSRLGLPDSGRCCRSSSSTHDPPLRREDLVGRGLADLGSGAGGLVLLEVVAVVLDVGDGLDLACAGLALADGRGGGCRGGSRRCCRCSGPPGLQEECDKVPTRERLEMGV